MLPFWATFSTIQSLGTNPVNCGIVPQLGEKRRNFFISTSIQKPAKDWHRRIHEAHASLCTCIKQISKNLNAFTTAQGLFDFISVLKIMASSGSFTKPLVTKAAINRVRLKASPQWSFWMIWILFSQDTRKNVGRGVNIRRNLWLKVDD